MASAERRATTAAPTTAGRSSSRPSGSRTSPGTSSPAAWPAPRRCSGSRPGSPATTGSRATRRSSRPRPRASSPALLIADLGRPDAVPQHAARLQGDVADERRHLGAVGQRRERHGRLPPASSTGVAPRAAPCRRGASAVLGAGALHVHGRARSPTRPCPSGTRRAASCRSCSPAAPRPAPAPPRRCVTPAADAGPARRLLGSASRPSSAALVAMERRLGPLGERLPRGPGRALLAGRARRCIGGGAAARRRRGPARRAGARSAPRWCSRAASASGSRCSRRAGSRREDPRCTVEPQRARLAARANR